MMARTAMTDRAMGPEMGPGERATLARQRYKRRFFAGMVVFGLIIGGLAGGLDRQPGKVGADGLLTMSLHPGVAVALALAMVIAMVALPIYMFGKIDELAVRRNLRGMAAGWLAVMGGYPAWFLLAAGGLAPAPTAIGIFLIAYGVTLVTFVILKWRD